MPKVVDAVNVVNSSPSAKKSRPTFVLGMLTFVLVIMALKAAPAAHAGPDVSAEIEQGICSMFDQGADFETAVTVMQEGYGAMAAGFGQPKSRDDWRDYVREVVSNNCPEYLA